MDDQPQGEFKSTLEIRIEALEREVQHLKASRPRLRPAGWPKLDANYQPFCGRFADDK